MTVDFPGFASFTTTFLVGGLYTLSVIATSITQNLLTNNNIPVTCTYNATTQLFTFNNTTTNLPFTLSGLLLLSLSFTKK